jgi:hypothetical protein
VQSTPLLERHRQGSPAAGSEHSAAVHRDTAEGPIAHTRQQIASGAEHAEAPVVGVSDDELIECRGRAVAATRFT